MKFEQVDSYSYTRKGVRGVIKVKPYKRKKRPEAKNIHYGKPVTITAVPRIDEYGQIHGYKWKSFKRGK